MAWRRSVTGRSLLAAARGASIAALVLVAGVFLVDAVRRPAAPAARDATDDATPDGTERAPTAAQASAHLVQLDRDGQEKGGVETRPPVSAPYRDRIKVYGLVLGLDRLTPLYNAALTGAAQLQAADAKLRASRTVNARAKDVLKVFSTAKAQAEAAQAAVDLDEAGLAAARAQLAALRNTATQDWGSALGDALVDRTPLATDLVRRQRVLVQITLPAGVGLVPPGQLDLSTGAGAGVDAMFVSAATQTDARVQGATFLYSAPAASGLVAGTNIVAELPNGASQPGVDVPSSAVVWEAGKPWMYVRTARDTFERRAIDEGAAPTRDGGYIVPANSLPQDKPIVVAGAQILLSQEMRTQIPSDEDDR